MAENEEREALARLIEDHINSTRYGLLTLHDAILAAGFRRPTQGSENSAQNSDDEREVLLAELVAWQKHTGDTALANLLGRTAAALRRRVQGEPDVGSAASCAYCVGSGGYEDFDGEWVECSCQRPVQGEPSDAQVNAALLGYFPEVAGNPELQGWGKNTRERMRAALRAAFQTGENRDGRVH